MLSRLQVRELGVIVALDVDLESGLTAITGETGAGKTLIVEALDLLCGGRADATMVRAGAEEAVVEALFVDDGEEHLVSRTVPRSGRSRATIDGNLATVAMLEQFSDERVDLHGQHAHQSLLRQAVQRNALDRFAGVDLSDVMALRAQQKEIDDALLRLGGDDATRSRELDLLQFEVDEIERAHIESNDELERLAEEELLLAATTSLREATSAASELLDGSTRDGAVDLIGAAIAQLAAHSHLEGYEARLRAIQAELVDAQSEIHRAAESFEEDPTRQEFVRGRQEMLRRLVRKHGSDLCDVNKFAAEAHIRIDELSSSEDLRRQLNDDREKIKKQLEVAEQKVGDQRRAFAPNLARAVEGHLHDLALLHARVEIHVGESGIGDDVEFRLGANPGEPALSLSKVASGGELARAMLALRLVLSSGPATLIFDEVDAGIGGEAARAVGEALHLLGKDHQVLVVTHLAQVAAHADCQIVVDKGEQQGRTVAHGAVVEGHDRVVELARMLSGQPDSQSALQHASDLLLEAHGAH